MSVVREFIDPIIERAVEKKKQGKMEKDVDAAEEQTLLGHMVNLTDSAYYYFIHASLEEKFTLILSVEFRSKSYQR